MIKMISDRARAISLVAGSSIAAAVAMLAPAAHAQVTFSATAPQAALQTIVDGATSFFYANAPAVLLTGIAIGIVLGLAGWLVGRLMHRRSVK